MYFYPPRKKPLPAGVTRTASRRAGIRTRHVHRRPSHWLALWLVVVAFAAHANDVDGALEIRAAANDWITAFEAGDIDALMTHYTPDAFVALHGQPALRGRDAIRAYFEPKMGTARVEFDLEFERIEVHGDVAHLVSKYWYTGSPLDGGEPYRDAGRSALLYKRGADNRWRIHLDIDQATPDVAFLAPAESP